MEEVVKERKKRGVFLVFTDLQKKKKKKKKKEGSHSYKDITSCEERSQRGTNSRRFEKKTKEERENEVSVTGLR